MKTKNLIVAVILLFVGSFTTDLFAQETLKALVQKCEKMDNVNINVVRNRNKDTKKMTRQIVNISFNNNQALVDEFIAAFNKDKDLADQEIENSSNGKITNVFYRFGNTSYSFSQGDSGANISVIAREEDFEWKDNTK